MIVTEDARAIAVWQKLQEAQIRLNEATKIMSYMFERRHDQVDDNQKDACEIKYITEGDAEVCEE